MKTFRLKRRARAYQKVHGGRIVGTTGNYQVKKNSASRRRKKAGTKELGLFGFRKKAGRRLSARMAGKRSKSRGTHANPVKIKRPKGWVKAKAVKFVRGKVLIKR